MFDTTSARARWGALAALTVCLVSGASPGATATTGGEAAADVAAAGVLLYAPCGGIGICCPIICCTVVELQPYAISVELAIDLDTGSLLAVAAGTAPCGPAATGGPYGHGTCAGEANGDITCLDGRLTLRADGSAQWGAYRGDLQRVDLG